MLSVWSLLAILILTLRASVDAYMIDGDCGDDTTYVRGRVNAAFSLIDNAVTELRRVPLNPRIDDWHNTLFGTRFDATAEPSRNIRTRLEGLLAVRNYNNNDITDTGLGIIDVRFFCTAKRIEKVGDRFRNKDRGILYKPNEVTSQFASCYDATSPTLMITFTITGMYSEVQICPWFLSYARGFKFKDLTSLPSSMLFAASKIALPVVAKVAYTPIDAYVLIDKTIAHELMHVDQSNPVAKDVGENPYGLKNAKKILQKYLQDGTQTNPHKNATAIPCSRLVPGYLRGGVDLSMMMARFARHFRRRNYDCECLKRRDTLRLV